MPTTIVRPKFRDDPVPTFGFAILMADWVDGWFTECSGLEVKRDVIEHAEGGVNHYVHQLPGRVKQHTITLKHGLANRDLWNWFSKGLYNGHVEYRNISIVLYGLTLLPNKWWNVSRAYPVKWSGPTLNTNGGEVSVETVELVHHGLSMYDLSMAEYAAALGD